MGTLFKKHESDTWQTINKTKSDIHQTINKTITYHETIISLEYTSLATKL